MPFQLYADPFVAVDQPLLHELNCGFEPWSKAATAWIQGPDVIESMARGTTVWLFRNEAGQVLGFGSLGMTRRRWPPPTGGYLNLLIIPMLGLDMRYRGQPPELAWRYSHQILGHLISEARLRANQSAELKQPIELLTLYVHRDNVPASRLYQKFGFEIVSGFEHDEHQLMGHRLNILPG